MLLVPLLAVGALTVAAQADNLAAKVNGNGIATMEAAADDTVYGVLTKGDLFADNHFKIEVKVNADGSAKGTAHFVFGDEFANAWGANAMTLECDIDTGSVSEDGTVVLEGSSFEVDFDESGNVVFEEESPCEIIIDPAGSFSLRWCSIPALNVNGHLEVN